MYIPIRMLIKKNNGKNLGINHRNDMSFNHNLGYFNQQRDILS